MFIVTHWNCAVQSTRHANQTHRHYVRVWKVSQALAVSGQALLNGEQRKPQPHARLRGEVGQGKGNYKGREDIVFLLSWLRVKSDISASKGALTQAFAVFNEQIHELNICADVTCKAKSSKLWRLAEEAD